MNISRLHAGLGQFVIQQLSQLCELPSYGLIAGGAVEAVLSRAKGHVSPINDIDWFVSVSELDDARFFRRPSGDKKLWVPTSARQRESKLLRFSEPSAVFLDGYGRPNWIPTSIARYQVQSVRNMGLLNEVVIASLGGNYCVSMVHLLNSFDLNCTRVGVDLKTGLLHWDASFEYFFKTRQIQVASAHSPWHTAVRCVKKLSEMSDVYLDKDATLQGLCAWYEFAMQNPANDGPAGPSLYKLHVAGTFGEKYKSAFLKHESDLSDYFRLIPAGKDNTLWTLEPKAPVEPGLGQQVKSLGLWGLKYACNVAYNAKTQPKSRAKVFFEKHFSAMRLGPVSESFYPELLPSHDDCSFGVLDAEKPLFERMTKVQALVFASFYKACGMAYFTGQINETNLLRIIRVCAEHESLANLMLGWSMAKQLTVVNALKALEHEFSTAIYAYLEDSRMNSHLLADLEALKAYVTKRVQEDAAPLNITPMPVQAAVGKVARQFKGQGLETLEFQELTTVYALRLEGAQMHHCVGGYGGMLRENATRVFSMRIRKSDGVWYRSTVSLSTRLPEQENRFVADESLEVREHRASCNGWVSDLEGKVLQALIGELRARPRWSVKRFTEDAKTLALVLAHRAMKRFADAVAPRVELEPYCQNAIREWFDNGAWQVAASNVQNRPYVFAPRLLESFQTSAYQLAYNNPLHGLLCNRNYKNQVRWFAIGPVAVYGAKRAILSIGQAPVNRAMANSSSPAIGAEEDGWDIPF